MSVSAFALVTGRRLFASSVRQSATKVASKSLVRPAIAQPSLAIAARQSAIFEVSLLMCVSHYKHIGLCMMRNVFQTFRPLLITIVMGNLLKIGAFLLQFPIGFYAIFFFEAFYGIMQLAISFVFVCFFHNGMMMQRSRVLSRQWFRYMKHKVTGKVQGVFFRKYTQMEANRLQVTGWIANQPDGSVTGKIEGLPEQIASMVEWLRSTGSPKSVISACEAELISEGPRQFNSFQIRGTQ